MAGKPIAAFALVAVVSTLPAGSNGALTAYTEIAAANVDRKSIPTPRGAPRSCRPLGAPLLCAYPDRTPADQPLAGPTTPSGIRYNDAAEAQGKDVRGNDALALSALTHLMEEQ